MPGFLSAIFAAPDDDGSAGRLADHGTVVDAAAFHPAVHVHAAEGGTEDHADGSQTEWAAGQDVGLHLDLHAATQFAFDDQHGSSSG